VVTRANAYFIVRELPFDSIPTRFNITRRDLRHIAVVMDGKEAVFRIERGFLRPVIKGPESLLSPIEHEGTDERLFAVEASKEELRDHGSTGALAYLRRGETVAYAVSEDSLKGGIPAERSQIKNRRPYWYSLSVPDSDGVRIVVPEHLDKRYIATLLKETDQSVVIDKLYVLNPVDPRFGEFIHASLNSLLTWYQLELRGRTQLGEGVLEVKVPDWNGVLVLNPAQVDARRRRRLLEAYSPLAGERITDSLEGVGELTRSQFDQLYLSFTGSADAAADRLMLERELRTAVAERHDRRASVADAKIDRRRAVSPNASTDAHAARIAAAVEPFPDPRESVPDGTPSWPVAITGQIAGTVTIGTELFDQGNVYSSGRCIAHAGDIQGAQFLQTVLLRDPELTAVDIPMDPALTQLMLQWREKVIGWRARFDAVAEPVVRQVLDERLRATIRRRALSLLHAP
jgi:hypothetical protein